jgi:hypothetical protein
VTQPFVSATGLSYPHGYGRPVPSLAQVVLDTIVSKFEEMAEFVTPLPERRVISIGTISVDSPVLAVMYGGTAIGLPGNDFTMPTRGDAPRTVTFNIELWRHAPMSTANGLMPATDSSITEDALVTMQDSWALLEAAEACDQRRAGVVASVDVNPPSGDMQGVSMLLQVAIA